jgi:hypothetical protein
MGQIIRLPVRPARHPDVAADLDAAECVLLIGIRWWVASHRRAEDPMPRLCRGMRSAGGDDAAYSINSFMTILARTLRQPIAIHCPRCPFLSDDEKLLLHAANLAQDGDSRLAEKALCTALLSAQAAEFALVPLEGLGTLLAEARLIFRRRRRSAEGYARSEAIEPWIPPAGPGTIH